MTDQLQTKELHIGCVLMASGASTRFGEENKLLAEFRGKPLVAHVLSTLRDLMQSDGPKDETPIHTSSVSVPVKNGVRVTFRAVVVCEDARIERLARDAGFDTLCAPHPMQSDTVRDGLSYLLSNAPLDGCMFLAADQPLLTADSIRRLLAQFATDPSRPCRLAYRALLPVSADLNGVPAGDSITPGNPVIFPADMFDALLSLTGDQGGGILLKERKPVFVCISNKRELADIDTIADLVLF